MTPETQLQIDLVKWIRVTYPNLLFTSTQAGERRSKLSAIMMKRMGYTNGSPDLIIFRANNGFNGLLLELKTKVGKPSDYQILFKAKSEEEGYCYSIVYGLDQAKSRITNYIG
jgi:hypothetical protein